MYPEQTAIKTTSGKVDLVPTIPRHDDESFSPRDTASHLLTLYSDNKKNKLLSGIDGHNVDAISNKLQQIQDELEELKTKLDSIPPEVLEIMFDPNLDIKTLTPGDIENFGISIANLNKTWSVTVDDIRFKDKRIDIEILREGEEISDALEDRALAKGYKFSSFYYSETDVQHALNSQWQEDERLRLLDRNGVTTESARNVVEAEGSLNWLGAHKRGRLTLLFPKPQPAIKPVT